MKKTKNLIFFFLLSLTSIASFSQGGANDTTFNIYDNGEFGDGSEFNDVLYSTKIQLDGKILVGGYFSSYNGFSINKIARLNSDGSIDKSFNANLGGIGYVSQIEILSNGKILVAGFFNYGNDLPINQLICLNHNGTKDSNFIVNVFDSGISEISVQIDGGILIGGSFNSINGVSKNKIARIFSDGALDPNFNIGSGFNFPVSAILIQNDEKIIVGGEFYSYNDTIVNQIIRLNNNGSIDNDWFHQNSTIYRISTLGIQTDGKIVASGTFFDTNTPREKLVRFNINGTIDTSFNEGVNFNNSIINSTIQYDDKIILVGSFTNYDGQLKNSLVRLDSDGTIDSTFNIGNGFDGPLGQSLVQNDSSIIIIGSFFKYNNKTRNYITRLNKFGELDTNFCPSISFEGGHIFSTLILPNDKIIVGGNFSSFNNFQINNLVKLNNNGTIDTTFKTGKGFDKSVFVTARQLDDKIIVGGMFNKYNDSISPCIVRLFPDGKIDTSFHIGTGFTGSSSYVNYVNAIAIQPDGKIIIGGNFDKYNQIENYFIVRLNTDGSIDPSFNPGNLFTGQVKSIKILNNGKILVGGIFYSYYNNLPIMNLFRINYNGTLDSTFNFMSGNIHSIETIEIQNDNKILIGGYFSTVNGHSRGNIARLNTEGTLDTTFANNIGFDTQVNVIKLLANQTILVGGDFYSYNGINNNRLIRLNIDSNIDSSFYLGEGLNSSVNTINIQSDGKIIIGGLFTKYQDYSRIKITRLSNCSTISYVKNYFCSSYTYNNQVFTENAIYTQYLTNFVGCDSIIQTKFIKSTDSIQQNIFACDTFLWSVNNNVYTQSGTYSSTFINIHGCDSIVNLNLTITNQDSVRILNQFSIPSDDNNCNGHLALNFTSNYPVDIFVYNNSEIDINNNALFNNLCPGVHELQVVYGCNDTISTQFVIPVQSNYIFNNDFIDSLAIDSLGITISNCNIFYNAIDTAFIDSIWTNGNIVNVIWNIINQNGSNFDTVAYQLNNGPGVYWLQLNVYCPNKTIGNYFSVSQAIYFNENTNNYSLKSLYNQFYIYPNPTSEFVNIKYNKELSELIISDYSGKLIERKKINKIDEISISNYAPGIYFFEFISPNDSIKKKIIKY